MSVWSVVSALVVCAPSLGIRFDGGGGVPLSAPQNAYFAFGPSGALTAQWGPLRILDVELQLGYARMERKPASPTTGAGTLLTAGAGARVHRPLDDALLVPWAEALVQWGFSGGSRLPLALAAGVSLRAGTLPLAFGIYTRLTQVLGLGRAPEGYETFDATLLSFGFSLEYRWGLKDEAPATKERVGLTSAEALAGAPVIPQAIPAPDTDGDSITDAEDACPQAAGPPDRRGCPDSDGDLVNDKDDQCPRAAGKPTNGGCPRYERLLIEGDRLVLRQKLQFNLAGSKVQPTSEAYLDEAAQLLIAQPETCLRIEAHTDPRVEPKLAARATHAQAKTVREYLVRHGVSAARLKAQGIAGQQPTHSSATAQGRAANRRVELIFVACPSEATP
ncbi:MAG: OmpA family protein [Myxococcaceae bacterium]|nr:OmpA family protein [Myxococcaceae bacterium]